MVRNSLARCLRIAIIATGCLLAGAASAADTIRLAVQKTGTLAWELDVIRAHGLDRQADLGIEVLELASPEAGKIALRGGSVDIIVSDWLWVSRERHLGSNLVFHPYSSALGAVMVPPHSPIRDIAGLRGKKLAVGGGPIDKSWLLLRAAAGQLGMDLTSQATIVYGAPTLLAAKALQGEVDATLNYWNICAGLEARGFRRLVGVEELLAKFGARGRRAMIGYVFDGSWADKNRKAVDRFLQVARKAKEILATSDAEWERIARLVGAPDAATLKILRDRYREGVPRRAIDDEEADARVLYRVMAEQGGPSLVGPMRELAPGVFHRARSGS